MDNEKLNNHQRTKRHLVCNDEVFKLITVQCVREYLNHHPEMEGAKLSQNHILKQIATHYITAP